MSTIPSPRFFVYVLARGNANPFYVGKGSGDRVYDHDSEARGGHQCHKCRIIRKIWRQGGEVQRYIVFTTDDEAEAYAYEVETIALYGISTLANHSTGGKGGATGTIRSLETRAKMKIASKARMADPDVRTRMMQGNKAAHSTPEARAQQAAINRETWADLDIRARRIAGLKAASAAPEARARYAEINRRRWADPEAHARQRAKTNAAWADPNYRALQETKQRDPDVRARHSAATRAALADPDVRARQRAGNKRRWADPDYRERRQAAMKKLWEDPGYREMQRTKRQEARARKKISPDD
jgi:hypothetical protein